MLYQILALAQFFMNNKNNGGGNNKNGLQIVPNGNGWVLAIFFVCATLVMLDRGSGQSSMYLQDILTYLEQTDANSQNTYSQPPQTTIQLPSQQHSYPSDSGAIRGNAPVDTQPNF